jgi:hypothetical protein
MNGVGVGRIYQDWIVKGPYFQGIDTDDPLWGYGGYQELKDFADSLPAQMFGISEKVIDVLETAEEVNCRLRSFEVLLDLCCYEELF